MLSYRRFVVRCSRLLLVASLTTLLLWDATRATFAEEVISPTASSARIPAQYFAARGKLRNVVLSPDGSRYLVLETSGDRADLVVHQSAEQLDQRPVSIRADPGRFIWATWMNDNHIVATVEYRVRLGGTLRRVSRLISVKPDGSELHHLGRRGRPNARSLGNDRIAGFVPANTSQLLVSMQRSLSSRFPSVYLVNVETGNASRVQNRLHSVETWTTDLDGQVRLGIGYKDTRMIVHARRSGDDNWRVLRDFDVFRDPSFIPLSFTGDSNSLVVLSNHETDQKVLYKFNLETEQFEEKIYQHPKVDIEGAIFSLQQRKLIGVTYSDDQPELIFFERKSVDLQDRINRIFPGKQVRVVSSDLDERSFVVFVSHSTDPGSFYLLGPNENKKRLIGRVQPLLNPEAMSPVEAIEYRARDGMTIFGYLTRPKGQEAKNLPMVVLPHGGPAIRDTLEFNLFVQFLANRGYSVLQMNFRGSAGFGRRHLQSGYQQWGLQIQDDITDGVRWAIGQGIADPSRICIFGGSFGGFSALMGAVKTPELYQCAASLNGVTDILLWLRTRQSFTSRGILKTTVGDRFRGREKLKSASPLYNVEKNNIPLLVLHGEKDEIVSVLHAKRFVRALQRDNKDVEFMYFDKGNHELSDPQDRTQLFLILEKILGNHLAPTIN